MSKVKTLFFLILILAGILRLWDLTQYPSGFNADEAAIGYNAYSLLQTGKDEHGNPWPIHFKSFGDYKPGGYFYLVLPLVKFLGLSELAVRLPSALLGVATVLLVYLLVKELFSDSAFSLLASFFLAISPWHLHFSRGGWEANAGTTFIVLATWLFFKGLKNPRFYVLCSLFYVLAMYTYHSARIVGPLLVFGLVIFYRCQLFNPAKMAVRRQRLCRRHAGRQFKWGIISGVAGLILIIPLIFSFLSPVGVSRFSGVGFLSETGPLWRINELRGEHQNWNNPAVRLLHNKIVGYSLSFLENYLDHFQGEFLFLSGDVIERNRVPETGQMYLFEIPFLVLGIYFFLKNRPQGWQMIFLWLAVSPTAAAMTFQTPHALRAHNMVIPLVVISVYGLYQSLFWLKERFNKGAFSVFCFLFSVFCLWSVARYLHQYFVHYPKTYPAAWEYGFKELVGYVNKIEKNYEKIYVTDRYDQPYILFLFYSAYPPEEFQKEVILTPRDKFGFSTVRDFSKYHFEEIKWEEVKDTPNALIIGTDEEIPSGAGIIKTILFPNGKIAFKIAET